MTEVRILCARCGVPVRMTSLGCYGHLAPQVVGQDKPHPARPRPTTEGVPKTAAAERRHARFLRRLDERIARDAQRAARTGLREVVRDAFDPGLRANDKGQRAPRRPA